MAKKKELTKGEKIETVKKAEATKEIGDVKFGQDVPGMFGDKAQKKYIPPKGDIGSKAPKK